MTGAVVETIDLFPTRCELTGLDTPKALDGSSLQPHSCKDPAHPPVFLALAASSE